MNKKLEKQANETLAKIRALTRHIRNVSDNCILLGEKLILSGEIDLGKQLIANGFRHDFSKFFGIEWDNLIGLDKEDKTSQFKLKMAIYQHNSTNLHHPEAWPQGIKAMPPLFLLELLCDWKARSEEFGTSLIEYIDNNATKRFKFDKNDEVYKTLIKYLDLLCDKPFVEVK